MLKMPEIRRSKIEGRKKAEEPKPENPAQKTEPRIAESA